MARTGIKLVYLYKIAAIAVLLSCYSHAINWDIQIIESNTGGISGVGVDMILDVNGVAHVVYFDDEESLKLKYAYKGQDGWNYETVADNLPTSDPKAVLAIGADGVVYVVYLESEGNLVYKKKENGQWSSGTIFYADSVVYDAQVNSQDRLNVAYTFEPFGVDDDASLKLYSGESSEEIETHGNYQSASLVIDSQSNPHLCYYDALNELLKYSVKDGNSWIIETVDDNIGDVPSCVWGSASLVLDCNDVPHISYHDFTNTDLKYANRLSGSWTTQILDDASYIGQQTCIAIDSNDKTHICYKHFSGGRVFLKHISGTESEGWRLVDTVTDFDRAGDPAYLSLACDRDNNASVCYTVPSLDAVEYAISMICGDLDKNFRVDFFDFSILAQHWYDIGCTSDDYCSGADINTSGAVDINDLDLFAESWLDCLPPGCY